MMGGWPAFHEKEVNSPQYWLERDSVITKTLYNGMESPLRMERVLRQS